MRSKPNSIVCVVKADNRVTKYNNVGYIKVILSLCTWWREEISAVALNLDTRR